MLGKSISNLGKKTNLLKRSKVARVEARAKIQEHIEQVDGYLLGVAANDDNFSPVPPSSPVASLSVKGAQTIRFSGNCNHGILNILSNYYDANVIEVAFLDPYYVKELLRNNIALLTRAYMGSGYEERCLAFGRYHQGRQGVVGYNLKNKRVLVSEVDRPPIYFTPDNNIGLRVATHNKRVIFGQYVGKEMWRGKWVRRLRPEVSFESSRNFTDSKSRDSSLLTFDNNVAMNYCLDSIEVMSTDYVQIGDNYISRQLQLLT